MKALTGKATRVALGRRAVLDGKVAVKSDGDLHYESPGERLKADSYYRATQFDRVLTEGRIGKFKAGEEIRSGSIRLQTV